MINVVVKIPVQLVHDNDGSRKWFRALKMYELHGVPRTSEKFFLFHLGTVAKYANVSEVLWGKQDPHVELTMYGEAVVTSFEESEKIRQAFRENNWSLSQID